MTVESRAHHAVDDASASRHRRYSRSSRGTRSPRGAGLAWLAWSTGSSVGSRLTCKTVCSVVTWRSLGSALAYLALLASNTLSTGLADVPNWAWLTLRSRKTSRAALASSTSRANSTR